MASMEVDRNGLEVPSREECLELIRHAAIGRLAIHSGALPTIVPVNFVLTDFGVVIRTAPGSKLDNALEHAVVAFEVDDVDPLRHTGWSVVITGLASEVTDPDELEVVRRLPLAHWAPGPAERYVSCRSTSCPVVGSRPSRFRSPAESGGALATRASCRRHPQRRCARRVRLPAARPTPACCEARALPPAAT